MKILIILSLFFVASCATTEKRKPTSASTSSASREPKKQVQDDDFYVSNQLQTVIVSESGNRLTPYLVDKRRADMAAKRLAGVVSSSKKGNRKDLVALMSAQRLAGSGLNNVMETAKKLVLHEIQTDPKRGLPGFAKLELALSAVHNKKYSFAEYYLYDLTSSSNKALKSAAYTLQGIIHINDDRLPEAVESWLEALKADPTYRPALLNLGFVSLKFGDFDRAKQYLSKGNRSWYESYGLLVAERMTNGADKAAALCRTVLSANPRHKPTLLSCALNEYQGTKNFAAALSHVDKLAKIPGNQEIDSIGYQLRKSIEAERSRSKATPQKEKSPEKKSSKKSN